MNRSLTARLRPAFLLSAFALLSPGSADLLTAQTSMHPSPPPFVEVNGTGEVEVDPDRATVLFAVETEAATSAEAGAENARLMTAVLAAVRGAGVPGLEVESQGYALEPIYTYDRENQNRPRIDGYRVRNHVRAETSDPTAVGEVIDAAIGAGANRVASLNFEASDTEEAGLEALRLAVAKARREAEVIASAMGATLGEPLEVRGGATPIRPQYAMMRAEVAMAAAPSTPIEVGSQTVSASISIRFRIVPAGGR